MVPNDGINKSQGTGTEQSNDCKKIKQVTTTTKTKKKSTTTKGAKLKKPPTAPKRFKTAYICFSSFKHKEIREQREQEANTDGGKQQQKKPTKATTAAKIVSNAWKELSEEQLKYWEDMSRKDKARWDVEKEMYNGPWKLPAKEIKKKDPDAPKRPMSSYIAFANTKRSEVKKQNPMLNNTEIYQKLADMWREAPDEEKKEYVDEEYKLRQIYLSEMAEFKKNKKAEEDAKRAEREAYASSIATQLESLVPQDRQVTSMTTQQMLLQNADVKQNRNNKNIMAASGLILPETDQVGTTTFTHQQQQQLLLQQNSIG